MIGPIHEYISWVTAPQNGYLTEAQSDQWDQFAQHLPQGANGQQNLRAAVGPHLPELIPDALHQDPELDLGCYWMGLEDPRMNVVPDEHPFRGSHPENIDLEQWFGRDLGRGGRDSSSDTVGDSEDGVEGGDAEDSGVEGVDAG
jgi:hypothetical protein